MVVSRLCVGTAGGAHGGPGALLACVARTAEQEKRVFLKWEVLNWNQPAIDMYKALGADFMDEWRSVFLTGDSLQRLAEKAS